MAAEPSGRQPGWGRVWRRQEARGGAGLELADDEQRLRGARDDPAGEAPPEGLLGHLGQQVHPAECVRPLPVVQPGESHPSSSTAHNSHVDQGEGFELTTVVVSVCVFQRVSTHTIRSSVAPAWHHSRMCTMPLDITAGMEPGKHPLKRSLEFSVYHKVLQVSSLLPPPQSASLQRSWPGSRVRASSEPDLRCGCRYRTATSTAATC